VNPAPKLQPAVVGGLVIGVLSALPLISLGNCCCCLWVIAGGIVAAWLMQLNYPYAITVGDGALVGLLAGLVGAGVMLVVSVPVSYVFGPFQERLIEQLIESSTDLPPGFREGLERARVGQGPLSLLIGFLFQLFVGSVFATLGGVFGALLFRKGPAQGTAPPPSPAGDYAPPAY
jgi:hypothetical protein